MDILCFIRGKGVSCVKRESEYVSGDVVKVFIDFDVSGKLTRRDLLRNMAFVPERWRQVMDMFIGEGIDCRIIDGDDWIYSRRETVFIEL